MSEILYNRIEDGMMNGGEFVELMIDENPGKWLLTVKDRKDKIYYIQEVELEKEGVFSRLYSFCSSKRFPVLARPQKEMKLKKFNPYDTIFVEPTGDVYQDKITGEDYNPAENQLYFIMRDQVHEFAIGVAALLSCLRFAELNHELPDIPEYWWTAVKERYEGALRGSYLDERL